jgi:tight adherence protein B
MGAAVGLTLGLGLLLVWRSGPRRGVPVPRAALRRGWSARTQELLAQAGIVSVTPAQLATTSLVLGAAAGLLALAVSRAWPIGVAFGAFATLAPLSLVRWRRRTRRTELREVWPDAVDNLASAVRAGLSLPEALSALGQRGPAELQPAFRAFGEDYRATGRFGESLDRLKAALSDPVGDRVVEALRLAREVGGHDLGRLLRTLSGFLREDARARAELETRQGWTVNAARLALAAPWLLLALLSLRPSAVEAYDSAAGAVVLLVGGVVSVAAYRLMLRIARLPAEARVLL